MLKLKFACALLFALPMSSFALGFQGIPTHDTLRPPASFEIGEAAVNTLLNDKLAQAITVGQGIEQIRVVVKKIKVDFEVNSCTIDFVADVSYGLGIMEQTEQVVYFRTLTTTAAFTYDQAEKQVMIQLPQFLDEYKGLPPFARDKLKALFEKFPVYSRDLISNIAGSSGVSAGAGEQISGVAPMFYMGWIPPTFSFHNDYFKVSLTPTLVIEDMTVQLYREFVSIDPEDDEIFVQFTIVTNFSGEVSEVKNYNTALSGPYALSKSGSGRYARYNYVTEPVRTVNGKTKFTATIANGNSHFRISTGEVTTNDQDTYVTLNIK